MKYIVVIFHRTAWNLEVVYRNCNTLYKLACYNVLTHIYIYIYVMGDITWLPFSIEFLCIAAVSKSPPPLSSGQHNNLFLCLTSTSCNPLSLDLQSWIFCTSNSCVTNLYNKLYEPINLSVTTLVDTTIICLSVGDWKKNGTQFKYLKIKYLRNQST